MPKVKELNPVTQYEHAQQRVAAVRREIAELETAEVQGYLNGNTPAAAALRRQIDDAKAQLYPQEREAQQLRIPILEAEIEAADHRHAQARQRLDAMRENTQAVKAALDQCYMAEAEQRNAVSELEAHVATLRRERATTAAAVEAVPPLRAQDVETAVGSLLVLNPMHVPSGGVQWFNFLGLHIHPSSDPRMTQALARYMQAHPEERSRIRELLYARAGTAPNGLR